MADDLSVFARLKQPFPPQEIEWRVGSTNGDKTQGLALAYLTARHVMERLDEVVGVGNWQDRYEFHGTRTVCYLSIRLDGEWVTKADGAGDSDVEAEKGAISDALKRAAVKWGIGRYLYDLGNTWVAIEAAGRSFRIKREEYAKLETKLAQQFGSAPPPQSIPRISAFRAKQLLKTDVLLGIIDNASPRQLKELEEAFAGDLSFLPGNWIDGFRERMDARRQQLSGDVEPTPTPDQPLDRQFAETMRE
jgi:hypothetical protein